MTGLDKILAQIEADTDRICEEIKFNTVESCREILNSATINAEEIRKKGLSDSKIKKADIVMRAKSTANLESRRIILNAKQQIISDLLEKSRQYLCDLPDKEYFALILKMVAKYSEALNGEIYFSAKDLKRLPLNFENELCAVSKSPLKISDTPVIIDGGFILKYSGIEINCGFSSLFLDKAEQFSDAVSSILFGKGA